MTNKQKAIAEKTSYGETYYDMAQIDSSILRLGEDIDITFPDRPALRGQIKSIWKDSAGIGYYVVIGGIYQDGISYSVTFDWSEYDKPNPAQNLFLHEWHQSNAKTPPNQPTGFYYAATLKAHCITAHTLNRTNAPRGFQPKSKPAPKPGDQLVFL